MTLAPKLQQLLEVSTAVGEVKHDTAHSPTHHVDSDEGENMVLR
jgi:hypothetical protein